MAVGALLGAGLAAGGMFFFRHTTQYTPIEQPDLVLAPPPFNINSNPPPLTISTTTALPTPLHLSAVPSEINISLTALARNNQVSQEGPAVVISPLSLPTLQPSTLQYHFHKVHDLLMDLPQSEFLLQELHSSLQKVWIWYKLSGDPTAKFLPDDLHLLIALEDDITQHKKRIKSWAQTQDFIGKPDLSKHLKALTTEVERINGATNRKIEGRLQ
jgi:hypothetical protein